MGSHTVCALFQHRVLARGNMVSCLMAIEQPAFVSGWIWRMPDRVHGDGEVPRWRPRRCWAAPAGGTTRGPPRPGAGAMPRGRAGRAVRTPPPPVPPPRRIAAPNAVPLSCSRSDGRRRRERSIRPARPARSLLRAVLFRPHAVRIRPQCTQRNTLHPQPSTRLAGSAGGSCERQWGAAPAARPACAHSAPRKRTRCSPASAAVWRRTRERA
jgi:hypothetical protein